MITTYKNFVSEAKSGYKNYQPEYYGIYNYEVVDGFINTRGAVNIDKFPLTKLPFKFGKVGGSFEIKGDKLTSLVGCPKEVGGFFRCSDNPKLITLEGCPKIINGNFYCNFNKSLKNYDHCPEYVEFNFLCSDNTTIGNCIDDYPMCIIEGSIVTGTDIPDIVCDIIKKHRDTFIPLIGNRIRFNQHIMRIQPDLIKYFKKTSLPQKRTII